MNFFKLKSRKSPSLSHPPELLTPTPPHLQRCPHVSRNGRRCRYRASSIAEPYCKYHRPPNSVQDFRILLEKMAQNFDTADGVNNVLYTIFFWLASGYISERKAGVLTYVAQTVLNSQRTNLQLQKLIAESKRSGLSIVNPYEIAQLRREQDQQAAAKSSSAPELPSSNSPAAPSTSAVNAPSPEPTTASPSTSKQIAPPDPNPASAPVVPSSAPPETFAVPQSISSSAPPPSDSSSSTSSTSSTSSASATSATSSTSSASSTPPPAKTSPPPKPPAPPIDLNHFYPRDPTLPVHIQDPRNFYAPPPLNRPRYKTVRRPNPADDDWKIINGR